MEWILTKSMLVACLKQLFVNKILTFAPLLALDYISLQRVCESVQI